MKQAITILFLLIGFVSFGQYPSIVRLPVQFDEIKMGKKLILPFDTVGYSAKDTGAVTWGKDGCFYALRPTGWKKMWCDTSTGYVPPPVFAFSINPESQTVTSGATFNLSAAVVNGTGPYTWNWYKVGSGTSVATSSSSIPSVTQSFAGITSTEQYYARSTTTANGTITSTTATVTVTSSPMLTYGYSSSDPFVNSSTAPSIGSPTTVSLTHNANITFNLPAAAADKYWVVKEPVTEPLKISWYHNTDNSGPIPGDVVRVWTVGSFRYYASVSEFVLTYTDAIQLRQ